MIDSIIGAFNLDRFIPWIVAGLLTLIGFLILLGLVTWINKRVGIKKEQG